MLSYLSSFPRLGALASVAALAWSAIPSPEPPAPAGLSIAPAAAAAFLSQPSSALLASSFEAGSQRVLLPSSVMPFTPIGGTCSVETTDPGAPPRCSAALAGGVVQRCSAHCDSQQRCSAFLNAAGGTAARCSTLGGAGPACSVLQPPMGTVAPSQCSAFGGAPGTQLLCSVIAGGARQFCSAENPANVAQNQCSTFQSSGSTGGALACSVLFGGAANKNFCSVRNASPTATAKFCSAHAANSRCSVRIGSRGNCTSLAGAPAGTCSAYVPTAHCSVIGGAAGTTFCKWP